MLFRWTRREFKNRVGQSRSSRSDRFGEESKLWILGVRELQWIAEGWTGWTCTKCPQGLPRKHLSVTEEGDLCVIEELEDKSVGVLCLTFSSALPFTFEALCLLPRSWRVGESPRHRRFGPLLETWRVEKTLREWFRTVR